MAAITTTARSSRSRDGSSSITTLTSFNGTNGLFPISSLTEDASGNLFGTALYGGANNDGTVFELAASSGTITTLVDFNGTNGLNPVGSLVDDASGRLFGATGAGGIDNDGTIFEVTSGSVTINLDPANQTVAAGNSVTFTASATGNPSPTVQWEVSSNGGSSFRHIPAPPRPVIHSAPRPATTVTSTRRSSPPAWRLTSTTAATLTVDLGPTVTTNPTSQTVAAGSNVTFTAAATANPTATVQWEVSSNGGSTFSNISGATSTSYSFTATSGAERRRVQGGLQQQRGQRHHHGRDLDGHRASPEVFVIGTDQQIYYQLYSASGMATTGFMQSAPGGALAIAAGESSIGPEIFVIGTDHQIYYQQLNANGTPMAGASFQQSAPGGGLAIAVGRDSIGPEIFLIGTDHQIYYQQLNANGTPMAGASFQQSAPGGGLAIAVGQSSIGPEIFLIGTRPSDLLSAVECQRHADGRCQLPAERPGRRPGHRRGPEQRRAGNLPDRPRPSDLLSAVECQRHADGRCQLPAERPGRRHCHRRGHRAASGRKSS